MTPDGAAVRQQNAAEPCPCPSSARARDWRPGHRHCRRAGHHARLASLHAGPPPPGRVQQPPARACSWPIGTFRLIGGAGPGRAGCAVGRLLGSCHLCRLGRRRRRLRHPAELLAARLVLLRHLSRPGRSYHRLLTPQRVPAQLGGRADQDRARQHVRHPDRRRRLHRPGRRAGRRGPRGRGAPGGIQRAGRPVLGRGRHQHRRNGRQVLQPLPGRHRSLRPRRNGDRHLPGQPARARPATAGTSTAGWPSQT